MHKKDITYEKKLVRRCVKGDKAAWDEFIDRYNGLIYDAILRVFGLLGYTNTEEAAEDLFQEVCAALLKDECRKLRGFKWKNGCTLASWLHVVAKNSTYDYVRKVFSRKDVCRLFPNDLVGGEPAVIGKLEEEDEIALFERALKRLPKKDIYLIELIYFRELPYEDAARILNKSRDALYMQKKRIIAKLKEIVAGYKREKPWKE